MVEVTNLSSRPVKIMSVYWSAFWKKGAFVMITGARPLSTNLPAKVAADGGTADFIFPESVFSSAKNIDFVAGVFGGRLAWLKSRLVRVGVATTVGKRFKGRLAPKLRDWLIQVAKKAESE